MRVVNEFGPEFVDIQGDGLFAIFHGDLAHERAMACAFTLKSFSSRALAPLLNEFLGEAAPEVGESGLKIGVAGGTLLAKRVGVRGDHNEPVWAGRPVNFATKCASAADRHEIVITKGMFDRVKGNDYIAFSCGCVDGREVKRPGPLWGEFEVETLGEHSEAFRFPGASAWCVNHGDIFCAAITGGDKKRDDIDRSALEIVRPEPTTSENEPAV